VAVKITSQEGSCFRGHKVGDEWIIGETTPAGICLTAFNDLFPYLLVLMWGGVFTWTSDPDIVPNVACSDAKNPVVFELRRIRED
jgi:uncharacterized repeat protein (TIGR04076 family)